MGALMAGMSLLGGLFGGGGGGGGGGNAQTPNTSQATTTVQNRQIIVPQSYNLGAVLQNYNSASPQNGGIPVVLPAQVVAGSYTGRGLSSFASPYPEQFMSAGYPGNSVPYMTPMVSAPASAQGSIIGGLGGGILPVLLIGLFVWMAVK